MGAALVSVEELGRVEQLHVDRAQRIVCGIRSLHGDGSLHGDAPTVAGKTLAENASPGLLRHGGPAHVFDAAEVRRRLNELEPPPPAYERGYGALYLDHVLQADEGADFDFLCNPSGTRPGPVPLGLLQGWVGHG